MRGFAKKGRNFSLAGVFNLQESDGMPRSQSGKK